MVQTLIANCCTGGVPPYGTTDFGVMLTGIAPGSAEVKAGRPHIGENGMLLKAFMDAAGWPIDKCYLDNIMCMPIARGTEPDPTNCMLAFNLRVAHAAPQLLIVLGAAAFLAITGLKIGKYHGVPIWSDLYKCYIMGLYQPISIKEEGGQANISHIIHDLQKIPTILSWPLDGTADSKVQYIVCLSDEMLKVFFETLPLDRPIAVDIETDNRFVDLIDIYSDKLLCIGFSYEANNGDEINFIVPAHYFTPATKWPDAQWGFQYGIFDKNGIRKYLSVQIPIYHDSLLSNYARDERAVKDETGERYAGLHGLEQMSAEHLGTGFYKQQYKRTAGVQSVSDLPPQTLYKYNADDVAYTRRHLARNIPKFDMHEAKLYDRLIELDNIYADITYEGICVDFPKLQQLLVKWGDTYLQEEQTLPDLAREYGYDGFLNLASPKQMSHFLYNVLGLPGGPSVARNKIEELDHPFIDKYLNHKRLDHILKHYVIPAIRHVRVDGRMHPSPMLHGTVTGRLAYSDPPIQTIPQEYTVHEFAEFRDIFVAQSDDYILLEADYEQIELWVAQIESGDTHMLEALESGDAHTYTAVNVLHLPMHELVGAERYEARQRAKKVNFQVLYYVGAGTLSLPRTGLGCTQREAQKIITDYFEVNHVYRNYGELLLNEVRTNGELVTPFGRKRRVPLLINDAQERQIKNFKIQSIANDITLSAVIKLYRLLKQYGARILFSVHDSVVFEIPKALLALVAKLIRNTMETPALPNYPSLKTSQKIGRSLYNMESYVA